MSEINKDAPSALLKVISLYDIDATEFQLVIRIAKSRWIIKMKVTNQIIYQSDADQFKVNVSTHLLNMACDSLPWINPIWLGEEIARVIDNWNDHKLPHTSFKPKLVPPIQPDPGSVEDNLSTKADSLPGMKFETTSPCSCVDGPFTKDDKVPLKEIIMHLNDGHEHDFTEQMMYDWLDELHDSGQVDLSIEIPDKEITI